MWGAYARCTIVEKILRSLSKKFKCTTIFCDNSSTIKLSKNPVYVSRSKHIDVRFHFLHDQVVDVMTKPLIVDTIKKFRNQMGICQVPELN